MAKRLSPWWLTLIGALLFPGCYRHLDYLTEFHIQGTVVDKRSGEPLGNVEIMFIDTGFDDARSRNQVPESVGTTDRLGNFDLSFDYAWAVNEGLFKRKPAKTCTLEFLRESYRTTRLDLRESDFSHDGKTSHIMLKGVGLVRE